MKTAVSRSPIARASNSPSVELSTPPLIASVHGPVAAPGQDLLGHGLGLKNGRHGLIVLPATGKQREVDWNSRAGGFKCQLL